LKKQRVLAGCKEGGIILDPFMGSGTTGVVALNLLRNYIGIEIKGEYVEMAERRIGVERGIFKTEEYAECMKKGG